MRKHLITLLLLVSLVLSSCVSSLPRDEVDETLSFVDDLGRTVTVSTSVGRVACLLGSFADVWMLSGGNVCATVSDAWDTLSLELGTATNLGGAHSPSLEMLIASQPDFVIASASTASHLAMREVLEALSIPVAYFDVDNVDDYLSMLKICTDLTGREDLYLQNGLILKDGIEALKSKYAEKEFTIEKKVLLLRASSTGVKVKGNQGTILGEMLADFGTVNIADYNPTLLEHISMEVILSEDPYHIFVVTMGADTELALSVFESLMRENPAWASLGAVEAGRVHIMEKALFNLKPNARYLEAYETLYQTLLS